VLIDALDRPRVLGALTGVLEKDASSASVEFRMLNGDGSHRWVEARYSPVRDHGGRLVEIEGIMIDVTERKAAEEQILRLARTDPLTGLANRTTFNERLHLAFNASRRGGTSFAVLYLDLDHFKDVNDTLGHPMGDLLLKMVAARLLGGVREADVVARFGGDEFAILQTDVPDPATAGTLAEKLRIAVGLPYTLKGNTAHVTASIGVAPLGVGTVEADAMLAQADLALYRAKDEGRDQYRFHTKDLDDEVRQRVNLTSDLREAIERGELELYYQPQVNLATGNIVGMEALARWHHPTRGMILPSVFISIAEKTGVILPLGRWILDQACGQMRRWRDAGIAPPVLAVNVSMLELRNADGFVGTVTETLAKWGLAPGDLELDVTESMLAQISWARNDVLTDLRKIGVHIALDDFGTDYSSFDYLRRYQINHIKIAQSFIKTAADNPDHAQSIRAIIALARNLRIDVIAEGVETADERALLIAMGATTEGQGFYFSAPVDEARASDLLRAGLIAPAAASPAVDFTVPAE
jgi:diguanylate cyclase (GGDEF)-like protein